MTVVILTAITDGFDTLKPLPEQDIDVRAICVTDDPDMATDRGWHIVHEHHPDLHPCRASKRPKCTPWEYTDEDLVIWIDASMRITSPSFARDVAKLADPIAQFAHPWRDCIYDEADACYGMPKYRNEPMDSQINAYRAKHPRHWGLWCGGLIARRRTPEIEAFGTAWLAEIDTWSFQDQLSEAFVLREYGLRPSVIPGLYMAHKNPWVRFEGSERHA